MLKAKETEEILEVWGARIVQLAQLNIGVKGRRFSRVRRKFYSARIEASGKLRKSMRAEFVTAKNSFTAVIFAEDYAEFVDQGRKPGKGISYKDLSRTIIPWMKKKRIRPQKPGGGFFKTDRDKPNLEKDKIIALAKFFSFNIKKFGIEPTNFLTDAIIQATEENQGDLVPALFNDIESAVDSVLRNLELIKT